MDTTLFTPLLLLLCMAFSACATTAPPLPDTDLKELIEINVTLPTQSEPAQVQVTLIFRLSQGQTYINDLPVKSGVTRLLFDTLISSIDSNNSGGERHWGSVSIRILVNEWPLASSSGSTLIVVEEELTKIDGNEVEQEGTVVLEILANEDLIVQRHSRYVVPLNESMLHSMPRENDVLFTVPNHSGKDVLGPLQTTSQYLSRLVETTVDEEPSPGELPETPLRAEPPDSYKVLCKWVDDFRHKLSVFWLAVLPVMFKFMQVVAVGSIVASIILHLLQLCIPSFEHKGLLLLDDIHVLPIVAVPLLLEIPEKKVEGWKEHSLFCSEN
ncbi:glycoprotein integral membrane protein 1 isoform X2 [Pleurodeles waltl]|uniref:glycoprotein integral membrane protein 1 isoform X2 n=1 Tax=Pleurodeles waltl TaxID=8319 RepID=UPI0037094C3A